MLKLIRSDLTRVSLILSVCWFLSACQTTKKQAEFSKDSWSGQIGFFTEKRSRFDSYSDWKLTAKVGLKVDGRTDSATMVWQKENAEDLIRIFGPLGAKAVKLKLSQTDAVLTDDQGVEHRGVTATALLNEVTGWPIPVDLLRSWIFGLPALGSPALFTIQDNYLKELDQGGWRVSYSYRVKNNETELILPRRILAQSKLLGSDVEVKVVIKSWNYR